MPQPELFVLLGMVVMFGSIVKGYWSGLLMIADLSGCYHQLLLPGVIAGGISYLFQLGNLRPLYLRPGDRSRSISSKADQAEPALTT